MNEVWQPRDVTRPRLTRPQRTGRRRGDPVGAALLLMGVSILVLGALLLVRWVSGAGDDSAGSPAGAQTPVRAPEQASDAASPARMPGSLEARAHEVVRAWDALRSDAWRTGDAAALGSLYARGAEVGRRDVDALERWVAAGWRVEGVAPRVEVLRVPGCSDQRCVVELHEEVTGAEAVRGERRVALPDDGPDRRRITYERQGGSWRVVRVRPLASPTQGG